MTTTIQKRTMSLRAVVGWIGLSQIIGYGTIFYSYAVIAPGTPPSSACHQPCRSPSFRWRC